MDSEDFEQTTLPRAKIGDGARFLVDNMDVIGVFFDGVFRTIEVPPNVTVEVASAEPGFKGDSVSNLLKNATTANGIAVKVPLFIKEGDKIKVDTRTGEYVERV
jgi:elongation factor P